MGPDSVPYHQAGPVQMEHPLARLILIILNRSQSAATVQQTPNSLIVRSDLFIRWIWRTRGTQSLIKSMQFDQIWSTDGVITGPTSAVGPNSVSQFLINWTCWNGPSEPQPLYRSLASIIWLALDWCPICWTQSFTDPVNPTQHTVN